IRWNRTITRKYPLSLNFILPNHIVSSTLKSCPKSKRLIADAAVQRWHDLTQMILTKSQYVAGVQCLKRLYLIVNEPQLAAESDASSEIMLAQGREVGLLARQLFPRGLAVDSRNPEQAVRATRELIANPAVPAIFEGAFEHKGVFVRVDILQRRKDKRWRLIEVKSTADLKDHHLDDVAIQTISRTRLTVPMICSSEVITEFREK